MLKNMVTSSLCVVTASIGRRSNEEIISPVVAQLIGGPSKRTKQSTNKASKATSGLVVEDILQGTMFVGNTMAKVIKELA